MNSNNEYLEVSDLVRSMARDFGFINNERKRREAIEKVLNYRYEKRKDEGPVVNGSLKKHALEEIKLIQEVFSN